MKKFIACIVAVCMCVTLMPKTALAEETSLKSQIPNAMVMMDLDNIQCEKIETLKDMELVIKNDYNGEIVEVATIEEVEVIDDEYAVMVLGQSLDEINEEVLDRLEVVQDELEALMGEEDFNFEDVEILAEDMGLELDEDEILAKMESLLGSYKIEIQGENVHYTVEEASGFLITSDLIKEVIDMLKDLLWELAEIDIRDAATISEAVESFLAQAEMTKEEVVEYLNEGFEGELNLTVEDLDKYMAEAQEVLDFLLSEEYKGTVFATGILTCDCVKYETYSVTHNYYKVINGVEELYDFETEIFEAPVGTVVKLEDVVKKPVYEGLNYTYVSSVDIFDYNVTVDQITVGQDAGFELIYKVVVEEEKPAAPVVENNDDDDNVEIEEVKVEKVDQESPETGDEMNLAAYIIAMIMAMGAMVVARGRK